MNDTAIKAREMLRRAILTLAAVPADRGPKAYGNPLGHMIVRTVIESYGYTPPAAVRFKPEPRDISIYLTVLNWLSWYEREVDKRMAKLFIAWAFETPLWMLARNHRRSEDTIRRWRDGVAVSIAHKFSAEIEKLSLDGCGECAAKVPNHEYDGDLRPEGSADLSVQGTPVFAFQAPDSAPSHDPESPDHKRTLKRLRKNARKASRLPIPTS